MDTPNRRPLGPGPTADSCPVTCATQAPFPGPCTCNPLAASGPCAKCGEGLDAHRAWAMGHLHASTADPFSALQDVTLTSHCAPECVHPDGEACGPPVIQPLDGFGLFLAQKYGTGLHSPGGPGL